MAYPSGGVDAFNTLVSERLITAKFQPVPGTPEINPIYVDSVAGLDQAPGNGTALSPYRTIPRAVSDATNYGLLDVSNIILQGADPHQIPAGFVFPATQNTDLPAFSSDTSLPSGYRTTAPFMLSAVPVLELTLLAANIVSQTPDPVSGLVVVVTNLTLVPGELLGLTITNETLAYTIANNDATTLFLCGTTILNTSLPSPIYSRGALIEPADPASLVPTLYFRGGAQVLLQGVGVSASAGGALKVDNGQRLKAIGCDFASRLVLGTSEGSPGFVLLVASNFRSLELNGGSLSLENSLSVGSLFTGNFRGVSVESLACTFLNNGGSMFSDNIISIDSARFQNCDLINCGSRGMQVYQGSLFCDGVKINDSNSAGIFLGGGAYANLSNVDGANASSGLVCQAGGVAFVASTVTLRGAAGSDFVVDSLAPVSVANFRAGDAPYSIVGPASAILEGTTGNPRIKAEVLTTTPLALSGANVFVAEDASAGAKVVNLPALSSNRGRVFVVLKADSSANAVTINRAGGDSINNVAFVVLSAQFAFVVLVAPETGTVWFVAGSSSGSFSQAVQTSRAFASVDSPVTVSVNDGVLLSSPDGGNIVVNLPPLSTVRGRSFTVYSQDIADNTVITPAPGETIDGAPDRSLVVGAGILVAIVYAPTSGTDWLTVSLSTL